MDTEQKTQPVSKAKKIVKMVAVVIILLIIIGIITFLSMWIPYRYHHPSTDDAYVNANVVDVAAQVNGSISGLYVQNLQKVTQGQLLFDIDPKPFAIAVEQAQAELTIAENQTNALHAAVVAAQSNLAATQAQLHDVQQDTDRLIALATKGFVATQDIINAKAQLTSAKMAVLSADSALKQAEFNAGKQGLSNAKIKQATAALDAAQLNLAYTHVYAPASGQLISLTLRPGSWVAAGQSEFSLIEDNSWWIYANYKESIIGRLQLDMPVDVSVDMYPNYHFKGIVEQISPGSGAAFSLLPPENATGNWVKVTQRFPVKIKLLNLDKNHPLRVGSSAAVTVDATTPNKINVKH